MEHRVPRPCGLLQPVPESAGDSWEVLSTGIAGVMTDRHDLDRDPDHRHFVLELLALV